ncbi:MAG: recombination regulator RecX [Gammaproteobacteria bacterium]|nr:recombination regulator RecX [Gammaproteobacteria bacterium]
MKKLLSIRNTAMNLLARREHSASELLQKLKQRDHAEEDILKAIEELQADNLQSDARFTESFINQRVNAGYGPIKIRHDLRNRGVNQDLVDAYLGPFQDGWFERMSEQRIRKFGVEIPYEYALKMKQARFLQNRGFSPESVMRLFR